LRLRPALGLRFEGLHDAVEAIAEALELAGLEVG